ncbi:DUF2382 domain-containing protein [Cryptosporangium aurantiacum]|uniref:Conserved domain-containing protein n=1 Tax=Cryptosporangium aurantiacum TaxID=134849 RepID=A0A1M7PSK0_9ACTN|nr:PRC and DUF2382 domain-containing protein [Cryptosporangium aurantiacum]SHN20372.1 conserved domain-containing protein [Cryptosporangium aurantiacum]
MVTQEQIPSLIDSTAYDPSGDKIGAIKQVYLDDRTDQPQFATVHTGLFGLRETFVPLDGAELRGDRLVVPVDKSQVKDAPRIDPDGSEGALTPTQVAELYRHYHLPTTPSGTRDTYAADVDRDTDRDRDHGGRRSEHGTGRTDDAMTRSEERLHVGTETHEAGQVRLRKHVVTENVQKTVPVSHERVRVEREPISEANREQAFSGPAISEAEHEVTLHAEKPVVEKEAVPVERVRLGTETVTEEQTVGGQVRKERIDTDER